MRWCFCFGLFVSFVLSVCCQDYLNLLNYEYWIIVGKPTLSFSQCISLHAWTYKPCQLRMFSADQRCPRFALSESFLVCKYRSLCRRRQVPENFRFVVQATLREFYLSIVAEKDLEQSWKKAIYKVIARMDDTIPEYFKSPNWMQQLLDG